MAGAERYDVTVIGAGPAGEKGAAQAAWFGKRVAVVEKLPEVGGACVNTGTIPSKTLRESALYFSGLKQRGLYGIDYSLKSGLTVPDFMYRLRHVQRNEWQLIRHNLFRHRVDLVPGEARFISPHEIRVDHPDGTTREIASEFFLVATGSVPNRPAHIPFDRRHVFDSDTILEMDHIPRSMAVVGAGVIGSEYACIFAALELEVTLVDGRDRPIPFADVEITDLLRARMENDGIRMMFGEKVTAIETVQGEVRISLDGGEILTVDSALFAAGRNGAVEGLGLEEIGVDLDSRGRIEVDEHYRTSVPNVYAAGDVIGFPALASTSMEQARVAMAHACGSRYKERVSPVLPFGIYTIPEVSMCGETEESCRAKGIPYMAGRARYLNNARGQIIGDTEGLLKVLFSPKDKRLIGVHIIGESAAELIHTGMACMESGGTIDAFIEAVYNFPTLTELYKYAAYDGLGRLAGR